MHLTVHLSCKMSCVIKLEVVLRNIDLLWHCNIFIMNLRIGTEGKTVLNLCSLSVSSAVDHNIM
jgi:hypothetical protein